MKTRLTVAAALTAGLLLVPAAASATTGPEFGTHVSRHAWEHGGFTGVHNPGILHRGVSNWDHSDWDHHGDDTTG